MPLPLKVVFVVLVLWLVGSVANLPNLFVNGLPLFGRFVYGISAAAVVTLLDVVGPAVFLIAAWRRKSWAHLAAFAYMTAFILNSAVALVTVRDVLGLSQILVPMLATLAFLAIVFWKRDYFTRAP